MKITKAQMAILKKMVETPECPNGDRIGIVAGRPMLLFATEKLNPLIVGRLYHKGLITFANSRYTICELTQAGRALVESQNKQ